MPQPARYSLLELDSERHLASFAEEARAGLSATPKTLPCRFFYDDIGSDLFEQICELPEYYLTRAESEILQRRAGEIAEAFSEPIAMVELGSGSSTKTRLLIDALLEHHGSLSYVPVDISSNILEASSLELLQEFERLEIRAIAGEYQDGLRRLRSYSERPKLVIWLGSTIGNLDRRSAVQFVEGLRAGLGADDRVLLGIDLRKDRNTLEDAYNDAAGLTSQFNVNLLERINRELGGEFDPSLFEFVARYDPVSGSVDSYLVSRIEQAVAIDAIGLEVHFDANETIHTESSVKYSFAEIDELAERTGLRVTDRWLDAQRRFSVNLFAPTG